MMTWTLHPQLAADTFDVIKWPLHAVRLMNDKRFPWLILVPARENLRDFDDIDEIDRTNFVCEINRASRILRQMTSAAKMNVAALGNMVPQLHIHVIARFDRDAAWPGPVWGVADAEPYGDADVNAFIDKFLAVDKATRSKA